MLHAVATLPPLPPQPQPALLFVSPPELSNLPQVGGWCAAWWVGGGSVGAPLDHLCGVGGVWEGSWCGGLGPGALGRAMLPPLRTSNCADSAAAASPSCSLPSHVCNYTFPPSPPPMLALLQEDAAQLHAHVRLPKVAAGAQGSGARLMPRLGRGGRLVFDRCAPWASFEPGTPDVAGGEVVAVKAEQQQQQGGSGNDEAAAAGGKATSPKSRATRQQQVKAEGVKIEEGEEGGGGGAAGTLAAAAEAADGGMGGGGAAAAQPLDPSRPLWEQPNPYAEWLNKSELAAEALAHLTNQLADGAATAAGGASLAAPAVVKLKVMSAGRAGGAGTPGGPAGTPASGGRAGGGAAGQAQRAGAGGAAAAAPKAPTPGTAGSSARLRTAARPPKAPYQRSNLGPAVGSG